MKPEVVSYLANLVTIRNNIDILLNDRSVNRTYMNILIARKKTLSDLFIETIAEGSLPVETKVYKDDEPEIDFTARLAEEKEKLAAENKTTKKKVGRPKK